jgi:DNA-binding MarR family transcriptional regulator
VKADQSKTEYKTDPALTREFLSSARVFAKAVRDVMEAAILREVAGDKLTFQQLKLLYLVAQTNAVSVGDAAKFLGVSSPAASRAVEKLVRRRLLRRTDIQGDRRSSHLSLTEASRRLLDSYEAARNETAAKVFSQFSPEELRHTSELLDRLAAGIAGQCADQECVCLQCEIYFRSECRFGASGNRSCFYRAHRNPARDGAPGAHTAESLGGGEREMSGGFDPLSDAGWE